MVIFYNLGTFNCNTTGMQVSIFSLNRWQRVEVDFTVKRPVANNGSDAK